MFKAEHIFVIFALIFGLIFVFITPPFQSVDENFHFLRAYGIASGDFIAEKQDTSVGTYMPASLGNFIGEYNYLIKNINAKVSLKTLKESAKLKLNPEDKTFLSYPNTALYSPVSYIVPSSVIFAAKFVKLPPLFMLYSARIFDLLIYVLLGYCALKFIPIFKQCVFLILLMPMNLSLGASVSSDAALIPISVLFFALLVKLYQNKQDINYKYCIMLTLFSLFFALTKQYIFMSFFVLLLPMKLNKKIIILLISIFAACLWSCVVKNLYIPLSDLANPIAQLKFILSNPLMYLFILVMTTIAKAFRLIVTSIGVLGWQDTRLDIITYITYPLLILITALNGEKFLQKADAVKMFLLTIFSYCVIVTLIYLSWTSPKAFVVTGLNGKYFTPILLPFLVSVTQFLKCEIKIKPVFIYGFSFLIVFSAVISVLMRFYNIFPNLYYQI